MPQTSPARPQPVSRSVRYAWFLLGGFVTLAVLAAAVLAIWQVREGNLLDRQDEQTTISSEGVPETVSIAGTSADVELIGAEADAVTAELDLVWYLSEPVVDSTREDSDLVVDLYCRHSGIPVWFLPECEIDYSAQIPHPAAAAVELTSGSVLARGLVGDTELQTNSGSIVVEEPAGSVDASASTGSISLELSEAPPHVAADTEFGDILVGVSREDSYRIITDTYSGRIDVEVATDPEAEATIDLRSTHGDITVIYFD